MKNLINKLEDYINEADFFEISDRRFQAIVELYGIILKLKNSDLADSAPSEDLNRFFEAIEKSIKKPS